VTDLLPATPSPRARTSVRPPRGGTGDRATHGQHAGLHHGRIV